MTNKDDVMYRGAENPNMNGMDVFGSESQNTSEEKKSTKSTVI